MQHLYRDLPPSAVMTEQYYAQPPAICSSKAEAYPVRIAKWAIHIRRGPGTEYSIVRIARGREIFMITALSSGTGASQWGRVQGGEGWISLDLTQRRIIWTLDKKAYPMYDTRRYRRGEHIWNEKKGNGDILRFYIPMLAAKLSIYILCLAEISVTSIIGTELNIGRLCREAVNLF